MIPDIKKILYTTDLSQNSAHAFRYAIYFSKKFDAEVIILHVVAEISEDARIVLEAYIDKERRQEFAAKKGVQAINRINKRLKILCDKELADDPKRAEKIASIEICKGYHFIVNIARRPDLQNRVPFREFHRTSEDLIKSRATVCSVRD